MAMAQWNHVRTSDGNGTIVKRKPLFLTKSFQLHDICDYVSIGF
jgi:hypothetical protein